MKTLANSKNNGDENSSESKHDSYFVEIFYVEDICNESAIRIDVC